MKVVKKVLAGLLAITCVAPALAGCNNEESQTVKQFEVWSPDSHSKNVMLKLVDEWNQSRGKELGVEIVYTVKEGDIQQATEMAFASDQGPEMFNSCLIEKNRVAGNIISYEDIEGGKEWIESTYKPEDYDGSAFKGDDGKVYCLPFNVNTFGLVYNKDMFKKYGIVDENGEPTPPTTFEEVREYAKRMTNPEEQDYGIIFPMKWSSFFSVDVAQLMIGSCGKQTFDCVTGEYNYEPMKPILEMYMGIKEDGSCFPGSESLDNDTARAYFAERNIGMKFAGSFDVGVFNSQFPAKCDWGVAPYPVADENNRYLQHMGKGGWYGMSKHAVEEFGDAVALEIAQFFYGDEMVRKLYAEGMAIPYDSSKVEGVEIADGLKGWAEFAALTEISTGGYSNASRDFTGEKNEQQVFLEDLWSGNSTIDEVIADLTTRSNAAVERYYANNPDKNFNTLLKTEWDVSRG